VHEKRNALFFYVLRMVFGGKVGREKEDIGDDTNIDNDIGFLCAKRVCR
jgi:hypothetical protein